MHNVYHYYHKKAIIYTKLSTYQSKSFNYFRMSIESFDDFPTLSLRSSALCRENSCTTNDRCV